ncbi:MAG TPA: aldehyde dehydrogenase family protein [Chryseolinea sp.]|nr:aldehyde dehydrogenase family protein [Chryseolinea sp.]
MVALEEKQGLDLINEAFSRQKKEVASLRIEPIANRKARLVKLRDWIHANRKAIHAAMYSDFQKNPTEVDTLELYHVLGEIKHTLTNLDVWSRPRKIDAPLTMLGTRSFIQYEPRGVALVISPWNYPFSLCIGPLVSALAAGNAVILKPSEFTPHVASIISRMVKEVFDPAIVSCFEGGPDVSTSLLRLPFDHIFFTGSPAIGKVVMRAAAENLSSVTLELGGKSPVIITNDASLNDAAQRIAFTKFVNNGQTCVAPDYILIDERLKERFTKKLIEQTKKLFAEDGGSIEASAHYCRIVNEKHFVRLNDLLSDALNNGAHLEFGGSVNTATRFIHPTILSNVSSSSRVMDEEIFGPILPIIGYNNITEAIKIVNSKPKALALYIFTNDSNLQEKILSETSAGGVCVNDCGVHFFHHNLPFGGVNNSGIGKSHGYYGFLAFSNEKPVLKQRRGLTTIHPFLPPYTKFSQRFMDWFLKLF